LAIELAAARVRLLSPAALLPRLADCLDALGTGPGDRPARQRTLRATIEWSTQLLEHGLADVLAALSVFADGWDLAAASQVCERDELTMLEELDELAGHSLLVVDTSEDEPRFRMMETVREYAAELLAARPDAEQVAARHTACFVALAERVDAGLRGADQGHWLRHLEREHGNLRRALRRRLDAGEHATVAFMARRLFPFWWLREHITEAAAWIEDALAAGDELEPARRLELLWTASAIAMEVGDWDRSLELATEAVGLAAASQVRPEETPPIDLTGDAARATAG
jgi:predicted ATPase